jgi:putative PIG3 family NAD(P)H quinone oxidoreductase
MSSSMLFMDHGVGGSPEVLVQSKGPIPDVRPGEVLIKVAYAGVNRPDVSQRMGKYPPPVDASKIMGLEVSGEIAHLGEGVTGFSLGDKVCALCNGGGYAEFVSVPVGQVLPIPKGLSLLEAAALPENFFTVWTNVFQRGKLSAGESFMVHGGSSGIGLTAIQLAKNFGAKVFCTVGNEEKVQACQKAGAELAINYKTQNFVDEIARATNKAGVNLILDMVGGSYIQGNLQSLSLDGRLVQIAFLQPSKVEVDWLQIMTKRLTYTGSTLRPRTAQDKAQMAKELLEHVWPLLENKRVSPVIYKVFGLLEACEAHVLLESSQHIGKIMLKVDA